MNPSTTYYVVKLNAKSNKQETIETTKGGLRITIGENNPKKRELQVLFKLYEKCMANETATAYVQSIAMSILDGSAEATYARSKNKKNKIAFDSKTMALNANSTEKLLRDAIDSSTVSSSTTVTPMRVTPASSESDEEPQDDASGDEKPQPTQGLPMPLTAGDRVEPDIEQSTPRVIDVDEWMAESSGSTPQSSGSTARIIRRRNVSGSSSTPITGKRNASGSSGSNSKRKKRKRSKKKIDRKDLLLEIHEAKDKAKKCDNMKSEGFQKFVNFASKVFNVEWNSGDIVITPAAKLCVVNILMIFVDMWVHSPEEGAGRSFVAAAFRKSSCTRASEKTIHKMLRKYQRGWMKAEERYPYDEDASFLKYFLVEGKGKKKKEAQFKYDRVDIMSKLESPVSNSKAMFMAMKYLFGKFNSDEYHLLELVKAVMKKSFKGEETQYWKALYALEVFNIITDDVVRLFFNGIFKDLLWLHYDDRELYAQAFQNKIQHYEDILESNDWVLKLLKQLDENTMSNIMNKDEQAGADLVVRAAVFRDHWNLIFTLFNMEEVPKNIQEVYVWDSLNKLYIEKECVMRKKKVSDYTAYIQLHKLSHKRQHNRPNGESYHYYTAKWYTKAGMDSLAQNMFHIVEHFLKKDCAKRISDKLEEISWVHMQTSGAHTNKFYSIFPIAYLKAAEEESDEDDDDDETPKRKVNPFQDGIAGIPGHVEGTSNAEILELSERFINYVNGIVDLCKLRPMDFENSVDEEVAKNMCKCVKDSLILSLAQYDDDLMKAYRENEEWETSFKAMFYDSLWEAVRVKQGGSTKQKSYFRADVETLKEGYCVPLTITDADKQSYNDMNQIQQPEIEAGGESEEEDDDDIL